MHIADALLSPAVGATMWAAAGAGITWSSRRISRDLDDGALPLMGVLGAFVFTVQMINFAIPGTGSSGHLGGGLLLAILLGPHAALLAMASILAIQALLFADGGLLAFGCNLVNLGFLPCFIGYPIFRRLAGGTSPSRLAFATIAAAAVTAQLGALAVVLETVFSGISELPFRPFSTFMMSIHLPIGIVEGIMTTLIVGFLRKARPEIWRTPGNRPGVSSRKKALAVLGITAVLTAGVFSWFASALPDGLEWSIMRTAGTELPAPAGEVHAQLAELQNETALFPGYRFNSENESAKAEHRGEDGKSLPGLIGGLSTLLLTVIFVWLLRLTRHHRRTGESFRKRMAPARPMLGRADEFRERDLSCDRTNR